jgi:cyclohexa-1,5-dienecarbonyl-CoA hydratase
MGDKLVQVNEKYNGSAVELIVGPAPANILSEAAMDELSAHLDKIVKDPNKKIIILTGAGDHFSFGASVPEHTPDRCDSMITKFNVFIGKMLACPVPILARVKGNCLGGALEVVLACHFVFAEKKASFAFAEIKLAVFPPPGSILLPLVVGDKIACQMVMTGAAKSAEELKNYNFINELSDDADAMDKAIDTFITKRIMPLSASSIRIANEAVRKDIVTRYKEHIAEIEKLYLKKLMSTHDAVEGIVSFMEKRPPKWTNN